MSSYLHIAHAAHKLGRSVGQLVADCEAKQIAGARVGDDGEWWVPRVWVDSQLNMQGVVTESAPIQPASSPVQPAIAAVDAVKKHTGGLSDGQQLLLWMAFLGLVAVVWFVVPWLLLVLGVVLLGASGVSYKQVAFKHWTQNTQLFVAACGVGVTIAGGVAVGSWFTRAAEARVNAERIAAAQAQAEAEAEALARANEQAREQLRAQAPETIRHWREIAVSTRDRVLGGEFLESLDPISQPPRGCPEDLPECIAAQAEFDAMRDEVAPLNVWLGALRFLEDERERIVENRVISQSKYDAWSTAVTLAASPPDPCPQEVCTSARRRAARSWRSRVERRLSDVLVTVATTNRMKLLYADLRESRRPVEITGVNAAADTYYNCAFRSQSRWRSIRVRSAGDFTGISVYCARGNDVCDRFYSRSAGGIRLRSITLEYPRRNRICEEGQARLISIAY